jgi:hypothetical protein
MQRTKELQELLDNMALELYGMTISQAQEKQICISCQSPVTKDEFADELSLNEYDINARCQACQDDFELLEFGEDLEEETDGA